MEHLQRVWHASMERLQFRTPGFIHFGTWLCSNCWDQFSQTCSVFSRLFILNISRYFVDFANCNKKRTSQWLHLGSRFVAKSVIQPFIVPHMFLLLTSFPILHCKLKRGGIVMLSSEFFENIAFVEVAISGPSYRIFAKVSIALFAFPSLAHRSKS